MRTFERICIQDYERTDSKGNHLKLVRGKEYLTSSETLGQVMVFTNFWVNVPVSIFAGEKVFTR